MKVKGKIQKLYFANKKLIANMIGIGGVKFIAIGISLCTTPAYLRYFSSQSILGLWLTIISLAGTISSMDLGLGIGLRNKLTESFVKGDKTDSKYLVSTSYIIMIFFVLIICPVFLLIINNANIGVLFNNVEITDFEQIRWSLSIMFISIMLQMVLRLVNSVLYALQEATLVSIAELSTSISMLAFVIIMPDKGDIANLRILTVFYCFASNLPYALLNIYIFCKKITWCRPQFKFYNRNALNTVLGLGLKFFYLTFMSMILHNTNEILISALIDTSAVVEYQIYNKVFNLISSVIAVVMIPLWSATTKALAEKNYKWLDTTHKILCQLSIASFVLGLGIIPLMQPIINIWLGDKSIIVNPIMAIPFAIYVSEETFNGANATIANGSNWIKFQMWTAPIGALLNFPITWLLNELFQNWIVIIIANILSLLPIAIGQFLYIRKKIKVCLGDS